MSDATSETAIPWDVYEQLLISLQDESLSDLLPQSTFLSFCRYALATTGAQESVPVQSLVDSITTPYRADRDRDRDRYRRAADGRVSSPQGAPPHYDLVKIHAVVQVLCDERRPTDGELGVD